MQESITNTNGNIKMSLVGAVLAVETQKYKNRQTHTNAIYHVADFHE